MNGGSHDMQKQQKKKTIDQVTLVLHRYGGHRVTQQADHHYFYDKISI